MSEPTYYKWLNGRESTHVPGHRYRLGSWREVIGPLFPCENGLHVCRVEHLSRWIARDLFVCEVDSETLDAGDKVVVRRCRIVEHLTGWDERTARLAAADFAEAVLPIFERDRPGDDRPRSAIQAARDYANGLIGGAARDAARNAARNAAGDAAGAAANAAAWAAARNAARNAAKNATWAAARDATWAAAKDATWAAAWDAARDAAWGAQGEIILSYAALREAKQ
jgi:hypothetical protein